MSILVAEPPSHMAEVSSEARKRVRSTRKGASILKEKKEEVA
jgi:hypothetical protein